MDCNMLWGLMGEEARRVKSGGKLYKGNRWSDRVGKGPWTSSEAEAEQVSSSAAFWLVETFQVNLKLH